jgi:hypothetical protein
VTRAVMCPVFMVNPLGVLFSLDPLLRPVYGYANMAANRPGIFGALGEIRTLFQGLIIGPKPLLAA